MIPNSLLDILICPDCGGSFVRRSDAELACNNCNRAFPIEDGILRMLPTHSKPLPATYNDPDYRRMSECFDDSSSYFTDGNSIFKAIHESSHRTVANWEGKWPTDGWILDIGCGQGYHWPFVPNRNRLIGLDLRLESLRKIRQHFPDAILIQGDLLKLPFASGTISRGVSIYALEHIYWLDDALTEIRRILADDARFLVGVPCEGGWAWNTGRKLTSERTMSKRYNVDYRKYIALEHCNTASKIERSLRDGFEVADRSLFPLPFLPVIGLNLTLSLALSKKA